MSTEVTQEQLEAVNDILQGGANVGTKTTTASQNATQNQNTTASNTQESEGSSTQTSSVEYKPVDQQAYDENKALQYMESMPFVDALKLAGIEKPDPKVLEDAKRRQKYRANAATLAETLRVLSDIGSGFAGGNVYARDNKDVEKANAEYDKDETAYNTKLNSYQQQLLQGILNDRATKLNLLNDIEKTFGRQTKTESENKQTNKTESSQNTITTSSQNSSQSISGDNRVTKDANGNYVLGGGSGSKDHRVPYTNGKNTTSITIKGGDDGYESFITGGANLINKDSALVKKLADKYGKSEGEVKAILANTKVTSEGIDSSKQLEYAKLREQMVLDMIDASKSMRDWVSENSSVSFNEDAIAQVEAQEQAKQKALEEQAQQMLAPYTVYDKNRPTTNNQSKSKGKMGV